MTDLFGVKAGTPKVCAKLLGEVLGVTFRSCSSGKRSGEWFVAQDQEKSELLLLLSNRAGDGGLLEPYASGYEVLFYVACTHRPTEISRKMASETSFRFLEVSEKLRSTAEEVLRTVEVLGNP